jgi:alpha-glucosidase
MWRRYARDVQRGDAGSTLALYTAALATRKALALGGGSLAWVRTDDPAVLAFVNGEVLVVVNLSDRPVAVEGRDVLLQSVPDAWEDGHLAADAVAWIRMPAGLR